MFGACIWSELLLTHPFHILIKTILEKCNSQLFIPHITLEYNSKSPIKNVTNYSPEEYHKVGKIYQANVKPMLSQINIGTGKDISILELANIMKKVVGFKGHIKFDPSKPNGTLRKLIDISKIKGMGWTSQVDLIDGLEITYKWYLKKYL